MISNGCTEENFPPPLFEGRGSTPSSEMSETLIPLSQFNYVLCESFLIPEAFLARQAVRCDGTLGA
jgi:hypothetical protein